MPKPLAIRTVPCRARLSRRRRASSRRSRIGWSESRIGWSAAPAPGAHVLLHRRRDCGEARTSASRMLGNACGPRVADVHDRDAALAERRVDLVGAACRHRDHLRASAAASASPSHRHLVDDGDGRVLQPRARFPRCPGRFRTLSTAPNNAGGGHWRRPIRDRGNDLVLTYFNPGNSETSGSCSLPQIASALVEHPSFSGD